LMTYHRAKGLEFDAVFLPRLCDDELPYRSRGAKADPVEERRLLYVGITRAKSHLELSWPADAKHGPSRFLVEMGIEQAVKPKRAAASSSGAKAVLPEGDAVFDALRQWRTGRSKADGVPPYVVFDNKTLVAISEQRPTSEGELASVSGVGPAKLE